MKIVHTYINNMYIDNKKENKECFAHRWGLWSLAKLGQEVVLVCGGEEKTRKEYSWNNIRIIELPTLIGINNSTRLLKGFIKELKTIEADVLHTHHYCSFLPEMTALVGRIRKIPTFITYHTTFHGRSGWVGVLERLYSLVMQPFFPLFQKMFFISNYIKDSWHFALIPSKKKKVVSNHFLSSPSLEVKRRKHSVLFMGRVTYLKGLDILIRAFAQVKKKLPSVTLSVVGPEEGKFGKKMRLLAKRLGLRDNLFFLGQLYEEKKWKQYYQHEILVIPSRGEGFGNVVIEGMLCGLPVIVSNRGALPEAAGGKGLVFDIHKPQELAEEILYLLENPSQRREIAREAKIYAQKFTEDKIGRILLEEYQKAIILNKDGKTV